MPRHGKVKNWEKVACSFSKRKAFKKSISPKDLKNHVSFLVWKLERASVSGSSKPARPPPSKRPFTSAENVEILAWDVGLEVLHSELSESNAEPTDHLNLWKGFIDLAKVVETLSASPLCREKGTVPIEEVEEALDVIRDVLQPPAVELLVRTSGGADSGPNQD